ncbi:DUF4339 domain-containing protein [Planctomicrobium piriforme]|uniref:GYF domain-containing protein n=1 Tax=Planctomicrobium piriforme TaxID=1576369 RepID=A0A1I3JXS2_9PLAN|nr:DUF4339 domain-containing protein [Planctomicrobium piriforme]SFI65057.1 hypothetical protein SAMN05421753_11151 [Planctomicrobium piriforme]
MRGRQCSPVLFPELLSLARSGLLAPDDLVRVGESSEWIAAGEVAGLFHMAGRAEEVSKWRANRRAIVQVSSPRIASSATVEAAAEISDVRQANDNSVSHDQSQATELPGEGSLEHEIKAATFEAALRLREKYQHQPEINSAEPSQIGSVIHSASNAIRRALLAVIWFPFALIGKLWSRTQLQLECPDWVGRVFSVIFSGETLKFLFRWGMTIAVPNLIAYGITTWSETQLQRYPTREMINAQIKPFPGCGPCSPNEYTFLLIDVMIFSAIVTYVGIRWLEAKAED